MTASTTAQARLQPKMSVNSVRLSASARPRRAGDAERHDEAEEDFAEPVGGLEVAGDEGAHRDPGSEIHVRS
jgi:hypothetical protein